MASWPRGGAAHRIELTNLDRWELGRTYNLDQRCLIHGPDESSLALVRHPCGNGRRTSANISSRPLHAGLHPAPTGGAPGSTNPPIRGSVNTARSTRTARPGSGPRRSRAQRRQTSPARASRAAALRTRGRPASPDGAPGSTYRLLRGLAVGVRRRVLTPTRGGHAWFCRPVPTADVRQRRPHPGSGRGRCSRVPTAPRPSSVQAASPSTRSGSAWSARSRQARTNDVDPLRATATIAASEEGAQPAHLRSDLADIDHQRGTLVRSELADKCGQFSPTKPHAEPGGP